MSYYFVSKTRLAIGDYIKPWNFINNENNKLLLIAVEKFFLPKGASAIWGAIMMDRFYQYRNLEPALIEYILEAVRAESYPAKKSRFEAIFLWEKPEIAHRFIEKHRNNAESYIYICELENGTAETFDMELINPGMNSEDDPSVQLERLYARARAYWNADQSMEWPETLAWGKVKVFSKL